MKTVLVVSAPDTLPFDICGELQSNRYQVHHIPLDQPVWPLLSRGWPDVVLLDCSHANDDSYEWKLAFEFVSMERLALILLVQGGRAEHRTRGFQLGARNCLTLPVTPGELTACLDSVLRSGDRVGRRPAPRYLDPAIEIDLDNGEVRRGGNVYLLTGRELGLLRELLDHPGEVLTNRELCRGVWGRAGWPAKRDLLKTYIMQLRQKLEPDAKHPRYILSRRGRGYVFMPAEPRTNRSSPVTASRNS